jgi:hypothetical protein
MPPLRPSILACLFASAVTAQQVVEGITTSQQTELPAGSNCPLVLPSDDIVRFDGRRLLLLTPDGSDRLLLRLPGQVFGSFTIQVDAGHVLFGESSTDHVWLVPLHGPAPTQPLATVTLNYDAVGLDARHVIVSAKTGGFSTPDNDLVLLDLLTGSTRTLAVLPGASGPVAVAANGDLYYATASLAFPAPPGQSTVLRFRRPVLDAAIQQTTVLGIADAEVVFGGLDAASDLCIDDDGDVLFADWLNNTVGEISDATSPNPWLSAPLVQYGLSPGAATLQFLPGTGAGVFEPFQPAGSRLLVFETDFVASSRLRWLSPARPELGAATPTPIPLGHVSFQVRHGPANGFGLLVIGLDATPGSGTFPVAGFEAPLHWSLALQGAPLLWPAPFDAHGILVASVWNPGFLLPTAATVQVAVLSTLGGIGSSTAMATMFGR